MRPAVALALALAACSSSAPPSTPQEAACAQRVNDDPAVREALANSAETEWLWQNAGKLELVKQQAIARCLQGRGGQVRGGVERPR